MDPTLLLTHAAVAAFALFAGLAIGRRHVAQQLEQARRREQAATGEIDALRTEVDTLRPLVWKVASLEGAIATHDDDVARIRRDAAAQVETYRLRLSETEWMVVSLQQALVAAQPPGATPLAGRPAEAEAEPVRRLAPVRPVPDAVDVPLPDALSLKLEQLRVRIGELTQPPRWQHQARER